LKDFAGNEWNKANRALKAAEALVTIDADSSVSRAYYAAFHAVTALFAVKDKYSAVNQFRSESCRQLNSAFLSLSIIAFPIPVSRTGSAIIISISGSSSKECMASNMLTA
jgi:hypothetical protein